MQGRVSMVTRAVAAVAYVAMLVVNGLAGSTTLIGGATTGQVSDGQPNLFAPAGITFAIWGLIYVLVGLFLLRLLGGLTPATPRLGTATIERVGRLFAASSVLNVVWLLLWQHELFLPSLAVMVALFVTLLRIHLSVADTTVGTVENLVTRVPFAVYYGWITVALVANVATWLVSIDWDRFGVAEPTWMMATVSVVAVIAVAQFASTLSAAYLATVAWAYVGIVVKHLAVDGWDAQYPQVVTVVVGWLLVFAVALAVVAVLGRDDDEAATRSGWARAGRWVLALGVVLAGIAGAAAAWWTVTGTSEAAAAAAAGVAAGRAVP